MDERLQFNWKMSEEDRAMLAQVANALHRSQADALRVIVRETHAALKLDPPKRVALPEEVAQALKDGRLTMKDLEAETLGLGDLNQYDLSAFSGEKKK